MKSSWYRKILQRHIYYERTSHWGPGRGGGGGGGDFDVKGAGMFFGELELKNVQS